VRGIKAILSEQHFIQRFGKRYLFEDVDMEGKIMLKWIYNKYEGSFWTGLILLTTVTNGSCEQSNEPRFYKTHLKNEPAPFSFIFNLLGIFIFCRLKTAV
jgi:hypothetical protein